MEMSRLSIITASYLILNPYSLGLFDAPENSRLNISKDERLLY
jgi:hypothetical protein